MVLSPRDRRKPSADYSTDTVSILSHGYLFSVFFPECQFHKPEGTFSNGLEGIISDLILWGGSWYEGSGGLGVSGGTGTG